MASDILENTPDGVADLLYDTIKDKVVCDIGCGEGDFMKALSRNAKKVIGIESDKDRAKIARKRGFKVYIRDSFFEKLPKADVYYSWTRDSMGVYLKAKYEGTTGTFIFGFTKRKSLLQFLEDIGARKMSLGKLFDVYITEL